MMFKQRSSERNERVSVVGRVVCGLTPCRVSPPAYSRAKGFPDFDHRAKSIEMSAGKLGECKREKMKLLRPANYHSFVKHLVKRLDVW